jgi:hypothetical protein
VDRGALSDRLTLSVCMTVWPTARLWLACATKISNNQQALEMVKGMAAWTRAAVEAVLARGF